MKSFFALLLLVTSLTATAQSRRDDGRIVLRNGSTTIRIGVNERQSDMNLRVRMLEEAVRDLQAQVYDLQDQPRTRIVTMHVCSLKTTFDGTFIGKASTQVEAEAKARNNCEQGGGSFCSSTRVACERKDEVVEMR